MKTKQLLSGIVVLACTPICAKQSLNASAGDASGGTGSFSYSVGQVFYNSFGNSNFTVLEGVHQPFEITTLGTDHYPTINLEMKVYPNPTTSSVFLKIPDMSLTNLEYQLYDLSGKLIGKNAVKSAETQIDLSKSPSGTFILIVLSNGKKLKTFKIIKN